MKNLGIIPAIALAFSLLALPGVATAVEIGQKAPDFELTSTQGGKFKLSDMAGKKNVVVQFYVLDFTPT
jgi:peroxiredoxin